MDSVTSSFQFLNYKVDKTNFSIDSRVGTFLRMEPFEPEELKMSVSIRPPGHLETTNRYFGGLDVKVSALAPEDAPSETMFDLEFGITGIFELMPPDMEQETLERIVRYQIPALLFSYIRAAIASFLANAGFPGVFLPLINVRKLAADSEVKIREIPATLEDPDHSE